MRLRVRPNRSRADPGRASDHRCAGGRYVSEALEVIGCLAGGGVALRVVSRLEPPPAGRRPGPGGSAGARADRRSGLGRHPKPARAPSRVRRRDRSSGILVLAVGAAAMLRWPILLPLLVIATLPFRVRLHVAGGEAVNLLVPLYVVIGSGVLATVVATLRGQTRLRKLPKPLVLALVVVDLPVRAADHLLAGRRLRRPQRRLLPDSVRDPLLPAGRGDLGSPPAAARPRACSWPRG